MLHRPRWWDSQLSTDGFFTGVYGSPYNANDWWSAAATPENVWIAKTNNEVSVWGLSPLCDPYSSPSCTRWSANQRIHQYAENVANLSYGGVTFKSIDEDVEDATVAGAQGSRTPGYSVADISIPGSFDTYAYNLNNNGEIVGEYCTEGCVVDNGFIYTSSTDYTIVAYPGAAETGVNAVNNLGQAVGGWSTSDGSAGGAFLYSNGKFSSITIPDACPFSSDGGGWYASGITDDGQIAGSYFDASCSDQHGFLLTSAALTTFDPPGSVDTVVWEMNGVGQIVGQYWDASGAGHGFIYSYDEGTFTTVDYNKLYGCYNVVLAINNNGTALAENTCVENLLLYDRGDFTVVSSGPSSSQDFSGAGLNDFFQIAGSYTSDSGNDIVSFLATPQE